MKTSRFLRRFAVSLSITLAAFNVADEPVSAQITLPQEINVASVADTADGSASQPHSIAEIHFRVPQRVDPAKLRKLIGLSPDVFEATHHSFSRTDFLDRVVAATKRIFLKSGFRDPDVKLDFDPSGSPVIAAASTSRYTLGKLTVTGAEETTNRWLAAQLRQVRIKETPDKKSKKPDDLPELAWRPGHPVDFTLFAMQRRINRFSYGLQKLNFVGTISGNESLDHETKTVNLAIAIPADWQIRRVSKINLTGIRDGAVLDELMATVDLKTAAPFDLAAVQQQLVRFQENTWVNQCILTTTHNVDNTVDVSFTISQLDYVPPAPENPVHQVLDKIYRQQIQNDTLDMHLECIQAMGSRLTIGRTQDALLAHCSATELGQSFTLFGTDGNCTLTVSDDDSGSSTSLAIPMNSLGVTIRSNVKNESPEGKTGELKFDWKANSNVQSSQIVLNLDVTPAAWFKRFPPDKAVIKNTEQGKQIEFETVALTLDGNDQLVAFEDPRNQVSAVFGEAARRALDEKIRLVGLPSESEAKPILFLENTTKNDSAQTSELSSENDYDLYSATLNGATDAKAAIWLGFANSPTFIKEGSIGQQMLQILSLVRCKRFTTVRDRIDAIANQTLQGPITSIAVARLLTESGFDDAAVAYLQHAQLHLSDPEAIRRDATMMIDSLSVGSDLIDQLDLRAVLEFAASIDSGANSTWGAKCRMATLMLPPADSALQRRENTINLIGLAVVAYTPTINQYLESERNAAKSRLRKAAEKRKKKSVQKETKNSEAKAGRKAAPK